MEYPNNYNPYWDVPVKLGEDMSLDATSITATIGLRKKYPGGLGAPFLVKERRRKRMEALKAPFVLMRQFVAGLFPAKKMPEQPPRVEDYPQTCRSYSGS